MSRASLLLSLFAILLAVMAFSLCRGTVDLPLSAVWQGLMGVGDSRIVLVMREIRLPRAVLGALVGAALGVSGAALQGLLRNPLAEPGLTGTSASAGLGAVIALYFGWSDIFPLALPLSAMTAGAAGTLLLLAVAGPRAGTLTMILAGIAVSSLAVALTALAMNLAPNPYALSEMVLWLMGSLRDRGAGEILLCLPFVVGGGLVLVASGRGLDALTLGEEAAASLGVRLSRLRLSVVLGAAVAVGASVSAVGSVGFVGLVVPHLLRPLVRHRPSALLIPSALGGAILVTVADLVVRLAPTRSEMMLGVVTSLVGAPFFLSLILKVRRDEP